MARRGATVIELILGDLGDDLKCCVCLEQLDKPVRLPCDHSMCAGCAQRTLSEYGCCPICKKPATQRAVHPNELLGRLVGRFNHFYDQLGRSLAAEAAAAAGPSQPVKQSPPPPPQAAGAAAGADPVDDFDVPGLEELRRSLRSDVTPTPNAPADISTDEIDAVLAEATELGADARANIERYIETARDGLARAERSEARSPRARAMPRILLAATQSPVNSQLADNSPSAGAKRRHGGGLPSGSGGGSGGGAGRGARLVVAETQMQQYEELNDSPTSEPRSLSPIDTAAAGALVAAASKAAAATKTLSAARPPACPRTRGTPASAARAPDRTNAAVAPAAAGAHAGDRSAVAVSVGACEEADDELCCVCGSGDWEEDNLIVFCARCNMAVHQVCYAVADVPAGDWLCDRCDQPADDAAAVRCAVCPSTTGAFKRTERGRWGGWIHVVCAQWIPGLGFKRAARLEAAAGVDLLRPDRLRLTCSLCAPKQPVASPLQHGGDAPLLASGSAAKGKARAKPRPPADSDGRTSVCVQCTRGKCMAAFHVTCAQHAGCFMQIREAAGGEDVVHEILCPKHSKQVGDRARGCARARSARRAPRSRSRARAAGFSTARVHRQALPATILVEGTPPSTLPGSRGGQKKRRSR